MEVYAGAAGLSKAMFDERLTGEWDMCEPNVFTLLSHLSQAARVALLSPGPPCSEFGPFGRRCLVRRRADTRAPPGLCKEVARSQLRAAGMLSVQTMACQLWRILCVRKGSCETLGLRKGLLVICGQRSWQKHCLARSGPTNSLDDINILEGHVLKTLVKLHRSIRVWLCFRILWSHWSRSIQTKACESGFRYRADYSSIGAWSEALSASLEPTGSGKREGNYNNGFNSRKALESVFGVARNGGRGVGTTAAAGKKRSDRSRYPPGRVWPGAVRAGGDSEELRRNGERGDPEAAVSQNFHGGALATPDYLSDSKSGEGSSSISAATSSGGCHNSPGLGMDSVGINDAAS